MVHCKVHNVRFYKSEPQAIRCMAVHNSTKRLAVSRSDASLEIWNLENTWFIERTLAPTTENFSIEDLAWCDKKLFSVGLHGLLVEYNLSKLCVDNRWAVTGEAAFCIDVNSQNSKIAIGTEQGYLNIFSVEEDGIYFKKFFDKQEGRIICLKFDSTDKFIVSGSIDVIRIWNVESGHAIHKMSTGRSETNKPTIVWCINITDDFTIISGDSRGKLTFWDGTLGSQIESYQSHKADILAICLSENQSSLYCAGVDPNIINYEQINMKDGMKKWVRSIQRKIHEHDVNALALIDNKLYSAGADSYLACSYHPPKTLLKVPPLLQNPCVQVAHNPDCILLRYSRHIELWSIGKAKNVDSNFRGMLPLTEGPKKLLELQRISKNCEGDEREGVICAAISSNGKWIIYSTTQGVHLFQFLHDTETPNLIKIDELEHKDVPCLRAAFTPNNLQLITYSINENICIYQISDNRASVLQIICTSGVFDCVTSLIISSCGKYLIIGDTNSNIVIWSWNSKKKEWINHCKLPRYQHPPMSMNIHPTTLQLVVVYSDFKMIEYDVVKKGFTQFSRNFKNQEWKIRPYPIRNITFDPRCQNIIMLHDDSNIIIINKSQKKEITKKNKLSKSDTSVDDLDAGGENFGLSFIKKYKHLIQLEWFHEDEMIAVELNPLDILEELPPAFLQNTFGKK